MLITPTYFDDYDLEDCLTLANLIEMGMPHITETKDHYLCKDPIDNRKYCGCAVGGAVVGWHNGSPREAVKKRMETDEDALEWVSFTVYASTLTGISEGVLSRVSTLHCNGMTADEIITALRERQK